MSGVTGQLVSDEWTLARLGQEFMAHVLREQALGERVDSVYECVVTGNGHPSLRSTVARHDDWISNANKLIWIIVSALVGQLIVSCGAFSVMVLILLAQTGVLTP